MAKLSALKNQLVVTTALAAVIFGYGRRAYAAACAPNPVAPDYLCSGVTALPQYITVNEAKVYTAAGFSITTAASKAITITGDGALSFTDVNASTIKGYYVGLYVQAGAPDDGAIPGSVTISANSDFTGTKNSGIFAYNKGGGIVSVTSDGTATGALNGIYAGNLGTDLTITTGVGSTATGTAPTGVGIFGRNNGSGILTITANGTATAKYNGIIAINSATATDLIVTTGASSSVTATTAAGAIGILAINNGSGATTVTANGIVTGKYDGINTYNSVISTGALTVNTGASTIKGTNDEGIHAYNHGSSYLSITAVGDVTGGKRGIYTRNAAGGTDLTIDTGVATTITGTTLDGIFALNDGTGALSITANGDAIGGAHGIVARNAGGDLTVTTGVGTTITGTTLDGIYTRNYGTGKLTVSANGDVTGGNRGILAFNFSDSLTITTDSATTVTGTTSDGIYTYNLGNSYLSITADGDVTGGNRGIFANNSTGTDLTIATGAGGTVTGSIKQGIFAKNNGSGYLAINASGDVLGKTSGIDARNFGTDLTITAALGSTITGTNDYGILGNNYGSGDLLITVDGDVTGDDQGVSAVSAGSSLTVNTGVGSTVTSNGSTGIRTFNTNASALAAVTANGDVTGADIGIFSYNFAGAGLSITTGEYSTVIGTGSHGIQATNKGTGDLTITADGIVTGGATGIYTYNATGGANLIITTGTGSAITGQNNPGINAFNFGTGGLSIDTSGGVTGYNKGIHAYNAATGTDLTITTKTGTTITGLGTVGIYANNTGNGIFTISANGDASGYTHGIYAVRFNGAGITVNTGVGSTVTGTKQSGINARNNGTGQLSISADGDVAGGTSGIHAYNYIYGATDLIINTGVGTTVTGTTKYGVFANNLGNGYLSITANGDVTGGGTGILAKNAAAGGDMTIITGAGGAVTGGLGGYGIFASNNGTGALSVTAYGDVKGWYSGIIANNYNPYSTTLTVTVDAGSSVMDMKFNGGVSVSNAGSGATAVNVDGYVWSADDGVIAHALAGNAGPLTVTTGSNSTIIGAGIYGGAGYGIDAVNSGTDSVLLTINGYVLGDDTGIFVSNFPTGKSLTVNTGAGSAVIGTNAFGIDANNFGSSYLSVTANGDVTGGITGVYARNNSPATDLTVTTYYGTTVTGTNSDGIYGRNGGSKALTITADGDVTANNIGISTRNYGTDLTIDTGAGTTVTGTTNIGIYAGNFGSGKLTVTADGDVMGGLRGIYARNFSGGTSLTVGTGAYTTVTGTTAEGILAYTSGSGALTVDAEGGVSGGSDGIYAHNLSKGTNLTVTTAAYTTVTGANQNGIKARNKGSGYLSVTASGDVTGKTSGIYTYNNLGAGALTINTYADITGGSNSGIHAYNKGGSFNINVGADSTVTGTNSYGIFARNLSSSAGAINIDVYGDVLGKTRGINAIGTGTGASGNIAITAENNSTITGTNTYGIRAESAGKIIIIADGDVLGGGNGIWAHESAVIGGPITIGVGAYASITGTTLQGIDTFTAGTGAISITNDGSVSGGAYGIKAYSAKGAISITTWTDSVTTGATAHGIWARNQYGSTAPISVIAKGDVTGSQIGISTFNYGTNLNIDTDNGTTVTGTNSDGIWAYNFKGYSKVVADGDVTGKGRGIYSKNSSYSTDLAITTGADSTVTGTTSDGMFAQNSGSGYLAITADGAVSGTRGIFARNTITATGALTITAGADSSITGTSSHGIQARNYGSAAMTITANGYVTSGDRGLWGRNFLGTALTIATGLDSTVIGTKYGIVAQNHGTAALTIDADGDITGGNYGIYAHNYAAATNLILTTGAGTTVAGTNFDGIFVRNFGTGYLAITTDGDVTGSTRGIQAYNSSAGINLTIDTGAGTTVTGTNNEGIFAKNSGTGALTITANDDVTGGQKGIYAYNFTNSTGALSIIAGGDVIGTSKYGIQAKNYTTSVSSSLSITAGNVTSNGSGIQARNKAGALTVGISGAVVANGGPGVYGTNTSGTDINITTDTGSSVKALSWAIGAYNNGTGTETIDVGGDATGGQFGVLAVNHGSGALKITTEGKISGASVAGIVGNNTGLDMTITTATDVLSKSGTGIWAINSKGLLSITTYGDVLAGTIGINATNTGNSTLTIATYANVSGNTTGIDAQNGATSGNLTIAPSAGTTITGKSADGIKVKNSGTGNLTITNLTGSLITGGTTGISALGSGGSYGIINNNISDATISGATGIHVTGGALKTGGIVNDGTIEGTGGTAISLTGLSASTPITVNGGNIIGDTIDDAPSNGFSPVTIAGDFTSEGSFDVSDFDVSKDVVFTFGKGTAITSFNTVDVFGSMIIPTDPTITGDLNIHDSGKSHQGILQVDADLTITGDLVNDGLVSIATGTTVEAGTMSAGTGVLSFGVTSKTDHAQLTLDSSPGDLTGQTITIDVSEVNSIAKSDKILLVDGLGALIGGPGKAGVSVTDNSILWGFKIIDGTGITDNSDLFLSVSFASAEDGGPVTPNNANVAETLVDLTGGPPLDPVLQEIVDSFNDTTDPQELNLILESLQPAEDGGSAVSTLTFVDNSINLTGERLNALREIGISGFDSDDFGMTGLSAGDGPDMSDERVWGQVSGQAARQSSRERIAGFDAALVAGTIGMDTENILENTIVGLAFSYGKTHIDSRNAARTDTDIDSYQATVYSDHDLGQGYYVTSMAGGAYNSHATVRHDVGAIPGLNAYGDFSSWQAAARAEAGRSFYVGYGTFTPIALANWVYYNAGDYTETGAGGASLHVSTQDLNQIDLGLGAKISARFTNADGARIVPEFHTSYRRELLGEKLETSSAFVGGGPAFSGENPAPAQDKFNVGVMSKYYGIDNLELTASYDLDLKAGFVAHSGFLRAGWKF